MEKVEAVLTTDLTFFDVVKENPGSQNQIKTNKENLSFKKEGLMCALLCRTLTRAYTWSARRKLKRLLGCQQGRAHVKRQLWDKNKQ